MDYHLYFQMSCKVMKKDNIVGICLNEVDFSDATKQIPSSTEAIKGKDIFKKRIIEFVEVLYKVTTSLLVLLVA